jgi:hypothetical protein
MVAGRICKEGLRGEEKEVYEKEVTNWIAYAPEGNINVRTHSGWVRSRGHDCLQSWATYMTMIL